MFIRLVIIGPAERFRETMRLRERQWDLTFWLSIHVVDAAFSSGEIEEVTQPQRGSVEEY